jgi:site-specific DNA recombinase
MAPTLTNVPGARSHSELQSLHTPTRSRAALTPRVPLVGKAAIYTRVSTDKQQDGASLDVQLDACRSYCESNGLIVVAEFRDVLSGLKTDRPQYRQAVDLARSKSVDKLVVWRLDRLGRDSGEYITQLRDLRKLGIAVTSVTQPGESILMQELMGVLAAEESRQLSVRITASKRRRAAEGKWSGGFAPMGYSIERHPDGGCVLVPNDDAPLIREMFKRYVTGKHSLRDLRDFMNENGHIITKQSLLNILKNPTYTGVVRQGYFSRSTLMAGPKEVREVKGLHQALVDEATFEKVQAKRKANRSRANGGTAPKYLFSGLTFCGGCGGRYTASWTGRDRSKQHIYYFCNRSRDAGDCKAHSIKESLIRDAVLPPLQALLERLDNMGCGRCLKRNSSSSGRPSMPQPESSVRSWSFDMSKLVNGSHVLRICISTVDYRGRVTSKGETRSRLKPKRSRPNSLSVQVSQRLTPTSCSPSQMDWTERHRTTRSGERSWPRWWSG